MDALNRDETIEPPRRVTPFILHWATLLTSVASAGVALLALAWWKAMAIYDDYGVHLPPATLWLIEWRGVAFAGLALGSAVACGLLAFSSQSRDALFAVIAIGIVLILTELFLVVTCIAPPLVQLIRDLS